MNGHDSDLTKQAVGQTYGRAQSAAGCAGDMVGDRAAKVTGTRPMTEVEQAHKTLAVEAAHQRMREGQLDNLHNVMPHFRAVIDGLSHRLYRWFAHQGFWGGAIHTDEQLRMKKTEKLALIITEVSECIEAVRKGDKENEAEELADTMVRLLDYIGGFDVEFCTAFHKKMVQNLDRPYRHGKHF